MHSVGWKSEAPSDKNGQMQTQKLSEDSRQLVLRFSNLQKYLYFDCNFIFTYPYIPDAVKNGDNFPVHQDCDSRNGRWHNDAMSHGYKPYSG